MGFIALCEEHIGLCGDYRTQMEKKLEYDMETGVLEGFIKTITNMFIQCSLQSYGIGYLI